MSARTKILIGIAVAAALAVVVWASLSPSSGKGATVELEKVAPRTVIAKVKASGTINPKRKVEIQSKVIGEITELPVREGDAVKAGQLLLQIEKKQYEAIRDQAKAALDQATVNIGQARAELANAELSLARVKGLQSEGVASQELLDSALLRRDSATIAVHAAEAGLRQFASAYQRSRDDLDRTTIRAPMDGIITSLPVEKGETAIMGTMNFAGSVLMTIGDLSELLAEVEVAESEVVSVALGQSAAITVDALPDTPLAGKVVEIGSSGIKQVDVVKFRVKVAIDAPDPRVKPGMTAKVEIRTARADQTLAVPQQAVQTRWLDGKGKEVERREGDAAQHEVTAVYLLADGKAQRREVTTGIHDELWIEVKTGLKAGDEVISGPYRTLRSLKAADPARRQESRESAAK